MQRNTQLYEYISVYWVWFISVEAHVLVGPKHDQPNRLLQHWIYFTKTLLRQMCKIWCSLVFLDCCFGKWTGEQLSCLFIHCTYRGAIDLNRYDVFREARSSIKFNAFQPMGPTTGQGEIKLLLKQQLHGSSYLNNVHCILFQ